MSLIPEKAGDKVETDSRDAEKLAQSNHSACSAVYRKTRDIRLTQSFARHKSILTTAVYSHPTDEDLLRAVTGLPC